MRVLFVLSFLRAAFWQMYYSEGIASLSAVLKKNGYKTDLFLVEDLADVDLLYEHIKKTKPDVIGFSVTAVQHPGIKWLSKEIKKRFKDIFIVAGGVHCTLGPDLVIKNKAIDAVCVGEGEDALLELVNKLKAGKSIKKIDNMWVRVNGEVFRNRMLEPNDINKLPKPDRELFHKNNLGYYTGSIWLKKGKRGGTFLMSRGCVFKCNYCSSPALSIKYGSGYFRLKDPRIAIKQIKAAVKKYKYDYLIFVDDTFTINKVWFNEFLDLYKKKVGLSFNIQTRINTFDYKMMRKMKEAGGYLVIIGVESGDEKIREMVLNRKMTNEHIKKGARMIKRAGMKLATYNMMGLPYETAEKFKKTVQLNAEIESDFPYIFIFYPYERTKLYTMCQKLGVLRKKLPMDFVAREDSPLKLKDFKREDIRYYYKNFYNFFELLKPRKGRLRQWLNSWWFRIGFVPPSSRWFVLSSQLWKLRRFG
jgi:radical SAM superfamily enzyme YgiQ (UPF0313 family)